MSEKSRVAPPPDLREAAVGDLVGQGRRASVYEMRYQDRRAVVKRYTQSQQRRCERHMQKTAAQFEYDRNMKFYAHEALRPHSAEPLAVLSTADGAEEVFVQEYVAGPTVAEYIAELGYLPATLFEDGRKIVEEFERIGLFDMDTPAKNVKVVVDERGARPLLFDFNLLPQCIVPPNPIVALMYKFGVRKPTHRDYRGVASWLRDGLLQS